LGLPAVGAFGDAHGLDAFGHHHARHVLEALEKFLEPELEVQPVPQHQLCPLRLDEIAGRGLVVVDFGAGPGNGFDDGGIACHFACHVGDDGEGGDDLELVLRQDGLRRGQPQRGCRGQGSGQDTATTK